MRFNPYISVLGFAFLLGGCAEEVESEDVRTTGIYPEIEVTASGNGTSRVAVRLKVGGSGSNTFLDLTGQDRLEATANGETKELDESDGHWYRVSFPTEAGGTEFTVAFLRGEADDSAPDSRVTLPEPFELSVDTEEASRADDDVPYSWEPDASGDVAWRYEGTCVQSDTGSTADDGEHRIQAGSIETFESDAMESCEVTLQVTRESRGSIDPAFTEGGRAVARQVRNAGFRSTP